MTICSSRSKKTESGISYGSAERKKQFKQSKIFIEAKSKFTNCSSRENDKNRKKFMRGHFGEDQKEQLRKVGKKGKKEIRDNLEEKGK